MAMGSTSQKEGDLSEETARLIEGCLRLVQESAGAAHLILSVEPSLCKALLQRCPQLETFALLEVAPLPAADILSVWLCRAPQLAQEEGCDLDLGDILSGLLQMPLSRWRDFSCLPPEMHAPKFGLRWVRRGVTRMRKRPALLWRRLTRRHHGKLLPLIPSVEHLAALFALEQELLLYQPHGHS